MGNNLKPSSHKATQWNAIREFESREVRKKLEEQLRVFFQKYQEHMLMPVSGELPSLDEPCLFQRVLKTFPMAVYQQAAVIRQFGMAPGVQRGCGPCAEGLLGMEWHDLDPEDYYPSQSSMEDYFWGHYLHVLAEEKGYKVRGSGNSLHQLVASGWHALERGSVVFPTRTTGA